MNLPDPTDWKLFIGAFVGFVFGWAWGDVQCGKRWEKITQPFADEIERARRGR